MAQHNDIGKKGEQMAKEFLVSKGYKILEVNWRFKNLEADIIAKHNNLLIVAEVKTRSTNFFGEPEEWVTRQKQRNLIKAANEYVQRYELQMEVRFDIVSVLLSKTSFRINHLEGAFFPML